MSPRKSQAVGLPTSRTPSPPESLNSTSSSRTFFSVGSNSSSKLSPPPSPPFSNAVHAPPAVYRDSTPAPRPRRPSPPQTLLGAIDENSGTVKPDVPLSADKENNPVAKLHVYSSAVNSKKKSTLACTSSPPANEFDSLLGPNGERFADLRMNRKPGDARDVFRRRNAENFLSLKLAFANGQALSTSLLLETDVRTRSGDYLMSSMVHLCKKTKSTAYNIANGPGSWPRTE